VNGKLAKTLRGRARGQTHGRPERVYEVGKHGERVLSRLCTRGVYRRLKREALQ
jgi:hypothetical protein